jgi:hypothetical protein
MNSKTLRFGPNLIPIYFEPSAIAVAVDKITTGASGYRVTVRHYFKDDVDDSGARLSVSATLAKLGQGTPVIGLSAAFEPIIDDPATQRNPALGVEKFTYFLFERNLNGFWSATDPKGTLINLSTPLSSANPLTERVAVDEKTRQPIKDGAPSSNVVYLINALTRKAGVPSFIIPGTK